MSSRWEQRRHRCRFYRLRQGTRQLSPRRVALLLALWAAGEGEVVTLSQMSRALDCDEEHAAEICEDCERLGLVVFDGLAFRLTDRGLDRLKGAS